MPEDNLLMKAGMFPLWQCSGCQYTLVTMGVGVCWWCEKGYRRDLSLIYKKTTKPPRK